MADLLKNEWLLRNNNSMFSEKTLPTPGVLHNSSSALQLQFNVTLDAFHKATREGFRLQDVNKAPLVQRRKLKKASDDRSSTDSSHSSGSMPQGSQNSSVGAGSTLAPSTNRESPVRNLSTNSNISNTSSASHSSTHSMGFVPQRISPVDIVSSQISGVVSPDVCVIEPSTSVDNIAYQEILSSDSEDSLQGETPFQASRGTKRKHSLEEDYSDNYDDSDDDDDDDIDLDSDSVEEIDSEPITIDSDDDEEGTTANEENLRKLNSRSNLHEQSKRPRLDGTIIIDD